MARGLGEMGAAQGEPSGDDLAGLIAARKGHFRYESGHHGDLWLELDLLYLSPVRLRPFAAELGRRLAAHGVEAICGPLVGGALLALLVAQEMDVEFYFAEQFTRPSRDGLYPMGYRIPDALRTRARGRRTAIVDDVINAGSAVRGAYDELRACGAEVVALGALLVLGSPAAGLAAREGLVLESLSHSASALWEPSACPLCAAGVPLEGWVEP